VIKYPTIPQTCRYTTLWNVYAQKSQWPTAEWSALPCKTQPLKTLVQKYSPMMLASFCSATKRYLQCSHWKTRRMTDCTQIPQPRRKTSRQNACAYKQRSVTDGISRRVTSGWHYISLILVDHGFKFNEAYYRNMMMLQYSSCPHTPRFQASSSSFSRTVPGAQCASGNQLFLRNFAKCWAILKIPSKQTLQ